MLLLAVNMGSLALLFATLAFFNFCNSDDEYIKGRYCTGTIYKDIRREFGVNTEEDRRDTLQAFSHCSALILGIATVAMSGLGLCTNCSSNKAFMICTVFVAALAFFHVYRYSCKNRMVASFHSLWTRFCQI